jgi:D-amino-acid dehydrogenase
VRVDGEASARPFDAVVLCAGLARRAAAPTGAAIPLVAVHGYSISAPMREPLNAPRSALMDERYKVAISRLGNRVRVAGSAEIGGRAGVKRASSMQTLYKVLHDWFPGAAALSTGGVQEWKGRAPHAARWPAGTGRQRPARPAGSTWASGWLQRLGAGGCGWTSNACVFRPGASNRC